MEQGSYENILKNRYFLVLWAAQILSQLADKVFFLFMVVLVTKDQFSNSAISGLTLVFTFPAVFFGSFAGVFVDRIPKRTVMIVSNVFRAAFVLLLPFSDGLYFIYFITFFVSTFTQFFAPAESSMIPVVVEKKDLLPANSLFMGTWLASIIVGFALGEPIISKFGENLTHFAISGMYLFACVLLLIINVREKISQEKFLGSTYFKELKEGINYVLEHKVIFFSIIRQIIIFSAYAALTVLVIGFVNDVLFLKPAFFGYLLAVAGIGMGCGSIFVGKFGNQFGKERFIFISFIFTGISLIIVACTNQIASVIGFDKITQQKQFYISLSTLNEDGKNETLIKQIYNFLDPNPDGIPKLKSGTKLTNFNYSQLKALSELTGIKISNLLVLQRDPKTRKLSINSLLTRISKGDIIFKTQQFGKLTIAKDNIEFIRKRSEALKFFDKIQNTYLIKEMLSTINTQNIVLNSILVLTDNDINNVSNLIEFINLDEDGYPKMKLHTDIQKMTSNSLFYLAKLLNIEQDELYSEEIQKMTLNNYLNQIIRNESSIIMTQKAQALKTLLHLSKTPIIKILLKKEASFFEYIFAFVFVCLTGFSSALSIIPLQTILQEIVAHDMRGKVFGVQNMAINTAMTLPMAIAGFAADLLDGIFFNMKGVPVVMILIGITVVIGAFVEDAFQPKKIDKKKE